MPRRAFFRRLLLGSAILTVAGCDAVLDLFVPPYEGSYPRREGLANEQVIVRVVQGKGSAPSEVGGFYADRVTYLHSSRDVNRLALVETHEFQPAIAKSDLQVGDTVRITTEYVGFYFVGLGREDVPGWDPQLDPFEGTFPVARQKLLRIELSRARP